MANIIKLKRTSTPSIKSNAVSEEDMVKLLLYLPTSIKDTHLLYVRSVYNNRFKLSQQNWTDAISVYLNIPRAVTTLEEVREEDAITVPLGLLYELYKCSFVNLNIVIPHAGEDKILLHTTITDFMDAVLMYNDDWEDKNEIREHVIEQLLFEKILEIKQSLIVLTASVASAFSSETHSFAEDSCSDKDELRVTRKFFKDASCTEIFDWAVENVEGLETYFDDIDDFTIALAMLVERQRQKIIHDPNFKQLKDLLNRLQEPED